MVRTIDQWKTILLETDQDQIPHRILGDLIHYRHRCQHEKDDEQQLMNALVAFATLEDEPAEELKKA